MDESFFIAFGLGALFGGAVAALAVYRRSARSILTLSKENAALTERTVQLSAVDRHIEQSFSALSQRALQSSSAHLVQLTKTELDAQQGWIEQATKHITERLREVDHALQGLEQRRRESEGSLGAHLANLSALTRNLQGETQQLRAVLSNPRTAGRWGETQLRNVIQAAGLLPFCDFVEQSSAGDDETRVRPDLLVRLPHGKTLVVDAKAPVQTLIALSDAVDEPTRTRMLKDFSAALRRYMRATAQRNYPQHFADAVPFTLIFIPGESLFSMALEQDPELLTYADQQSIMLCTPLSLIAYLRTVSIGWQERNLLEHATEIRGLASDLYGQLEKFTESFDGVGRSLAASVKQYNEACGVLERKALTSARRFREIEGGKLTSTVGVSAIDRSIILPSTKQLSTNDER